MLLKKIVGGHKGKAFLSDECQLLNVDAITELENHHFATVSIITD